MKNFVFIFSLLILITSCNLNKSDTEKELTKIDTLTTESGVMYYYLKKGDGRKVEPKARVWTYLSLMIEDKVIWDTNKLPDSLYTFITANEEVIKGFDEVTMKLREGDEVVAILPSHLAYGERGSGNVIPPNATLVYDLMKITKVDQPRKFLSDSLYNVYSVSGKQKMFETYNALVNTADSVKVHGGIKQLYNLWAKIDSQKKHQEAIEVASHFAKKTNSVWLRFCTAQSLDRLGETKRAVDSLEVMLKDAPNYKALSDKLAELKAKLAG